MANWRDQALLLLTQLLGAPCCEPFLRPVDPVSDGAPDYYEVIEEPIDLSTIRTKLSSGVYAHPSAFFGDLMLMVSNSKKYNTRTVSASIALRAHLPGLSHPTANPRNR